MAASRRPRHAGTERCRNGTKAVNSQLARHWRAAMPKTDGGEGVSLEKELRLAAEAVAR